jgi:hypothetical protein
MSLSNSRRQSHGSVTITSGVEEMSLRNSRRPNHGSITIERSVLETTLSQYKLNFSDYIFVSFA